MFITTLVNTMVFPFMSIYFVESFGGVITGFILSGEILASIIASFYGGYLADQLGRRKVMLVAESIKVLALFMICIANSSWLYSPMVTLIMMTISTIGGGIATPAAAAMIIDVSSSEERKVIYSIQYWVFNAAIGIGGLVGGFLFSDFKFVLFLIVALISLLSLIILFYLITETYKPTEQDKVKRKQSSIGKAIMNYREVLKDSTFILFTFTSLLVVSIELQAMNYTGVRIASELKTPVPIFSLDEWSFKIDGIGLFGVMNTLNCVVVVMFGAILGKWIQKQNESIVLYGGILIYAISLGMIAISDVPWVLLVLVIIAALSELSFWPIVQAYLADLPPEKSRSSYMAVNSLVGRGGMMLGTFAITIGTFIPPWGMGILFVLTGMISMFLFSTFKNKLLSRRQSIRNAR
ncbi:MFS transporter [Brevibacillus sp. AY1]|nr:MFS transporter [Brevibacillus sp. AY1]MDH4619717.1 MFS transporter [Brevibacillus sp. AY1]